jgi:hypothetical protein
MKINCKTNKLIGFEVITAEILKVTIFWDIALCSQYMNRRFGGTYHLPFQGRKSSEQELSLVVDG